MSGKELTPKKEKIQEDFDQRTCVIASLTGCRRSPFTGDDITVARMVFGDDVTESKTRDGSFRIYGTEKQVAGEVEGLIGQIAAIPFTAQELDIHQMRLREKRGTIGAELTDEAASKGITVTTLAVKKEGLGASKWKIETGPDGRHYLRYPNAEAGKLTLFALTALMKKNPDFVQEKMIEIYITQLLDSSLDSARKELVTHSEDERIFMSPSDRILVEDPNIRESDVVDINNLLHHLGKMSRGFHQRIQERIARNTRTFVVARHRSAVRISSQDYWQHRNRCKGEPESKKERSRRILSAQYLLSKMNDKLIRNSRQTSEEKEETFVVQSALNFTELVTDSDIAMYQQNADAARIFSQIIQDTQSGVADTVLTNRINTDLKLVRRRIREFDNWLQEHMADNLHDLTKRMVARVKNRGFPLTRTSYEEGLIAELYDRRPFGDKDFFVPKNRAEVIFNNMARDFIGLMVVRQALSDPDLSSVAKENLNNYFVDAKGLYKTLVVLNHEEIKARIEDQHTLRAYMRERGMDHSQVEALAKAVRSKDPKNPDITAEANETFMVMFTALLFQARGKLNLQSEYTQAFLRETFPGINDEVLAAIRPSH